MSEPVAAEDISNNNQFDPANCQHLVQLIVEDVPVADPVTYEFKGRFKQTVCEYCLAVFSSEPM